MNSCVHRESSHPLTNFIVTNQIKYTREEWKLKNVATLNFRLSHLINFFPLIFNLTGYVLKYQERVIFFRNTCKMYGSTTILKFFMHFLSLSTLSFIKCRASNHSILSHWSIKHNEITQTQLWFEFPSFIFLYLACEKKIIDDQWKSEVAFFGSFDSSLIYFVI